jgi:hypothetical protein
MTDVLLVLILAPFAIVVKVIEIVVFGVLFTFLFCLAAGLTIVDLCIDIFQRAKK